MTKKHVKLTAAVLSAMMLASALTGCGSKAEETTQAEATTEAASSGDSAVDTSATDVSEEEVEVPAGYHLVWHDEFNGTELNEDDWNREEHKVGWVNHELQEYIPSADYAFVKDGELVIQPTKTEDEDGNVSYVSGRVNTQNKHDIKYGWIEARLKVPQGKGYLPAFWMMPQEEEHYGQWPKCGEIDIMEVLGDNITTNYGTVHYGEPHKQNQGTYTLQDGDFANEYHTFAIEWNQDLLNGTAMVNSIMRQMIGSLNIRADQRSHTLLLSISHSM